MEEKKMTTDTTFATDADELVIGWFGRMGSGKTLNMTKWAIYFSELSNRKIYAKYKINHPNYIYFDHYKELENVRNAIILFDEIHTFFDSRNWDSRAQQKFTHWFTQTRKMNNSIFYTSQTLDQLEKRIRNNTLYVFWCQKFRKLGANQYQNFYEFKETLIDTQMGFSNAVNLKTFTLNRPELIYPYFNTKELIKTTYND